MKINPLFNPKSSLPADKRVRIRAESSVTPGVYSSPAFSSCLLARRGSVPPLVPTQYSAKPCDACTFLAQVEYLLLLFIYRLFIDRLGEFYFVSVEFE